MQKVLVSLPEDLASRMKAVMPTRQRSQILAQVIEKEVVRREEELYRCAQRVEKDKVLNDEMSDWDVISGDGIDPETW